MSVGDFNGGLKPDLATANGWDGSVRVLIGRGDGTFADAERYDLGGNTWRVAAAAQDNNDGRADVVASNTAERSIDVLLNTGFGTFEHTGRYPAPVLPLDMAITWTGSDGHADLVTVDPAYSRVGLLRGNGDGTFQPALWYPVAVAALATSTATGA